MSFNQPPYMPPAAQPPGYGIPSRLFRNNVVLRPPIPLPANPNQRPGLPQPIQLPANPMAPGLPPPMAPIGVLNAFWPQPPALQQAAPQPCSSAGGSLAPNPNVSFNFPDLKSAYPPTDPLPERTFAVCVGCGQAQLVKINIVSYCVTCREAILPQPENGMRYLESPCCARGLFQSAMSCTLFTCTACGTSYKLTTDFSTLNGIKIFQPAPCTPEEHRILLKEIIGPTEQEKALMEQEKQQLEQEYQKWKDIAEKEKKRRNRMFD